MTRRYLGSPSGHFTVDDNASDENVAEAVMRLLIDGELWVQLWYEDNPALVTIWTVLSRDEAGVPMHIASDEFDGTMEIINNDPQYESEE